MFFLVKRENQPIPMRFNKLYVIYEKDQDLVGSLFVYEHSSKNLTKRKNLRCCCCFNATHMPMFRNQTFLWCCGLEYLDSETLSVIM